MPNIASILKAEIARLARKEIKGEIEGLRKASAQYRADIADLKRRTATLEKQLGQKERKAKRQEGPTTDVETTAKTRFSAKGFATRRQKLGLTAADMGALLGVSAQTIYNWEGGKSRPRPSQLAAVAAVKGVGKREAKARLEAITGQSA
ncbi:MAG: helix-turn-helix domain-containing protein [Holophagaceae bacterium]|nr:helix-turn-helix domain-containing protein [Holophagaceae bacterium]